MARFLRLWVVILIAVGAALLPIGLADAQGKRGQPGPSRSQTKLPFEHIDERALAAKTDDPVAVRGFTDEILDRSIFSGAPKSVRDRLFRAELTFRRGQHEGVSEDDAVNAMNTGVDGLGGPPFVRVTGEQLHLTRDNLRFYVRHYARTSWKRKDVSGDMSPAEAAFVISDLATQKLLNPDYQVDANQWVQQERERRSRRSTTRNTASAPTKARWVVAKHPPEVLGLLESLERGLPDESGAIAVGAHIFLDNLGFAR